MTSASSRAKCFTGSVVGIGLGRFVFAAAAATLFLGAPALAGPKGEKVISGQAAFFRTGATTTIHAGNNAIINYSSFNIASHETVRFIQPSAASRVLNRVTSHDPSLIDGKLLSNGIVYIANPAGIFFGQNAIVNVGGIVAAAGTMTNQDFLAGKDRFSGMTGRVENLGTIKASSVDMVGRFVANHGVVYAERGTVTMTAGEDVLIGPRGGGLYVKVTGEAAQNLIGQAGVENTGSINAAGGASLLTAGDFYSLAVRNTGTITADRIALEGTAGGAVHVAGTLDASNTAPGGRGGSVQVLGERVAVLGATIDASGTAGGGEVLIGGDFQGGGDVRTADSTYVAQGSEVRADALSDGDGGRVIVWADDVTHFAGHISARGGSEGGDGGFAEVSGKDRLAFRGRADLRAAHGDVGTLLLDPDDITISNGASTVSGTGTLGDPFTTGGSNSNLRVSDLTDQLQLSDVVVLTGSGGGSSGNGDIFVNNNITHPGVGGFSLALRAHRNIELNANIDFSGTSSALHLQADFVGGDGDGAIINGGGLITMGTGSLLMTAGSGIGTSVDPIETEGTFTLAGSTATGGIFLTNTGSGNLTVGTVSPLSGSDVSGLTVGNTDSIQLFNTVGSINVSQAITGDGAIAIVASDSITLGADVDSSGGAGNVSIRADGNGGTVPSNGTGAIVAGAGSVVMGTGDLLLTAGSGIGVGNAVDLEGTTDLAASTATGGIFVENTASGNVNLTTVGGIVGAAATTSGDVLVHNAAGSITVSQAVTSNGAISLVASDNIALNANVNASGGAGNVSVRADGNGTTVPTNGTGAVVAGAGVIQMGSGDLLLTAGSGIGAAITPVLTSGLTDFAAESDTGGVFVQNSVSGVVNVATVGGVVGVSAGTAEASVDNDAAGLTISDPVSGGNVTLSAAGALTFDDDVTASGALSATATGAITDGAGADLNITGTALFRTLNNAGAAITLDNLLHQFGAITAEARNAANSANANGNITLVENAAMSLASLQTEGTASLTSAAGGITQSGALSVTGQTTLTAGAANGITLDNALNDFNGVRVVSGNTVSLRDANLLRFEGGDSTISGNLIATAGAAIEQGATSDLGVTGTSALTANAASNITLSNADNDFGGAVRVVSGNVVTLRDTDGLTFGVGDSTISGSLNVTTNGAILQSVGTGLSVAGPVQLTAGSANNITLDSATNNFGGAVAVVSGNNVTIRENDAVILGNMTVSGALSVIANGAITDEAAAALQVTGTASLTAGAANNITLDNSGHNFGGAVRIVSGNDVTLRDTNAFTLGNGVSTVSGFLDIGAGGSIVQSGGTSVSVAGVTILDAGTANVSLNQSGNDFVGSVTATGAAVTLVDSNAILLDDVSASGAFSVTSGGDITQVAATTISADSTTTLTAGANDVLLENATNDFVGGVRIVSADEVRLRDTNGLTFGQAGASTIGGPLTVTAGGDVTQTAGSLSVGGLTTINIGALANVSLTQSGNDFGTVNVAGGGVHVTLTDSDDLNVGGLAITGNLSLTSNGDLTQGGAFSVDGLTTVGSGTGNLTLDNPLNDFAGAVRIASGNDVRIVDANTLDFGNGASVISGLLEVTAGGDVTQSGGSLAVTGLTTVNLQPAASLTLLQAANDFGTVTVAGGGANVSIADADDLDIGGLNITGALDLQAGPGGAGALTQSGAIAVGGVSDLAAGSGGISLTNAANSFQGAVRLDSDAGAALVNGIAATTVIGSSTVAGLLDLTTTAALQFGSAASDVVDAGSLTAAVNGHITQFAGSDLIVDDAAAFTLAGANQDVLLGESGNNFDADGGGDGVSISNARDAVLNDLNALVLGDITSTTLTATATGALVLGDITSDALTATAGGAITQTGGGDDLTISGAAVVRTLNNTGAAITLTNTTNTFGTLTAEARNAANTSNAAGAIDIFESGPMTLASVRTAAAGTFTSTGAITDNGALTIGGASTFRTLNNTPAAITLNTAANSFGSLTLETRNAANTSTVAGAISVVEAGAMDLALVRTDGAGLFTATGAITDSGPLAIGGASTFLTLNNAGAAITLNSAGNLFGALSVSARDAANAANTAGNISVVEAGAMNLASVRTAGSGTFTAGGAITDSGPLTIGTTATFLTRSAAGANITLDHAASSFNRITARSEDASGTLGVLTAGTITINKPGAMTILDIGTAGTAILTATGSITEAPNGDAGADLRAANATLNAAGAIGGGAAGAIETAIGSLTAATTAAGGVTLAETDGITLASVTTASGDVSITAGGTIVATSVAANSDVSLTATGAGSDIAVGQITAAGGGTVALNAADAIGEIGAGDAQADVIAGQLDATAGSTIGGAGELDLETTVGTLAAASNGDIVVTETDAITLADVDAASGNIAIDSGGAMTAADVQATSGDVTLTGAGFASGTLLAGGGGDLVITSTAGADLGAVTAGTLTVTAPGGITDSGAVVVSGLSTLSAGPAGNITLDSAGNDFATVNLATGTNATLVDANALTLGPIGVTGDLNVDAGSVTFSGAGALSSLAVNSAGAVDLLAAISTTGSMSFVHAGTLTIDPALAGITAFGGFSSVGGGSVSLGTSITSVSGTIDLAGPVTLTSDVTLSGANIRLGSVDSDATAARDLTLDTAVGGVTTLVGNLGATRQLGTLATDADGSTAIAGNVAVQAETVSFGGAVASDKLATRNLTVTTTSGDASFAAGIDLSGGTGQNGGDLTIDSATDIRVGGDISTRGGVATSPGNAGGDVLLDAQAGSIRIFGIDASGSDALTDGAGGDGGTITLAPAAGLTALSSIGGTPIAGGSVQSPDGVLEIKGDLIATGGAGMTAGQNTPGLDGLGGSIRLAPAGRAGVPGVATIIACGRTAAGAITDLAQALRIDAGGRSGTGTVEFGLNEKFVVLGSVSITAGSQITVSDVSTKGDMTFTAPTLRILTRPAPADLLFPRGTTVNNQANELGKDRSTDFVAGGQIKIVASTIQLDPFLPVGADLATQLLFADGDGVRDGAPTDRPYLQFGAADLNFLYDTGAAPGAEVVLDLNARGSSAQNVATSLAGALPVFDVGDVTESTALDAGQKERIRNLGITPRNLSVDERFLVLLGRTLYNDYPQTATTDPALAATQEYQVAANRLPTDWVNTVIARYDEIYNTDSIDETGAVKRVSRAEEIRQMLGQSVRRYREQPGVTGMDPGAYRGYLEQNPDTETDTLKLVQGLETFLGEMKLLGLGPREEQAAFKELMAQIRPRAITSDEQMLAIVLGTQQ